MSKQFTVGMRVKVEAHGPDLETPAFVGFLYPAESGQLRAWAVVRDESKPTCMHPEFWTELTNPTCKGCEDTGTIKIRNPLGAVLCEMPCKACNAKANG